MAIQFKEIIENSPVVLLDRIELSDGSTAQKSDIDTITARVYDLDNNGAPTGALMTLVVDDVVYDTLQTGDVRYDDTTGYNFAFEIDGSYFPKGGRRYQVDVRIEPVDGNQFTLFPRGYKTVNTYINDVTEDDA